MLYCENLGVDGNDLEKKGIMKRRLLMDMCVEIALHGLQLRVLLLALLRLGQTMTHALPTSICSLLSTHPLLLQAHHEHHSCSRRSAAYPSQVAQNRTHPAYSNHAQCLEVPKRHPPKGHPQILIEFYLTSLNSLEFHSSFIGILLELPKLFA